MPEPLTHTPVKAHDANEPRAPSTGLTQRLSTPGSLQRWDVSFHTVTAGAPASQPAPYRLVRGMVRSRSLSRAPGASKLALHPREGCFSPISAVDLLSQEFVNRLVPELGAYTLLNLATFTEPRTRHACTERDTICPRGRGLAVAGITCLEWRVGRVPSSPAVIPEASTSRDAWSPRHSAYGRYRPLHELRPQDH